MNGLEIFSFTYMLHILERAMSRGLDNLPGKLVSARVQLPGGIKIFSTKILDIVIIKLCYLEYI